MKEFALEYLKLANNFIALIKCTEFYIRLRSSLRQFKNHAPKRASAKVQPMLIETNRFECENI